MILTSIGSFEFEPLEDSFIDSTAIDKIKSRPQISRTDSPKNIKSSNSSN